MADQVEVKLNCLSLKRAAPHQKIQESPPKKEARHQIRPQQESSLGNQASFKKRLVLYVQLPEAPTNAPVFMEDLPEDEQDVTGFAKYGAGDQFHPPRP
jgi:hypothetical protein